MAAKITFIGSGNMASAIVGGLISNQYPAEKITTTSPDPAMLESIQAKYSINTTSDNCAAIADAEIVVLAVKPQILKQVCAEVRPTLNERHTQPLVLSIAAGISLDSLNNWLGESTPIVRAMPNTPAMIGCGATSLVASSDVTADQKSHVEDILSSTGLVEWLTDESLINAATAVAGSAPAYFFLFFQAMEDAAVAQGLPRDTARKLTLQTGLGAASMALTGEQDPEQLMRNVMSPQGSTERAISSFENANLRLIVEQAMCDCADRAEEMQSLFG
ncbi:pyrroline-5-carboxylate reductase [uncultured Vibrio sp.]|uniref:pyrroline-5-carboxylate reductase n=1 Tax=Vibrio sp. TaxID=678 RepID=UPI002AA70911|nr:pyrroline-5-carboxylate reductase [uncultured Vibrio sp.]